MSIPNFDKVKITTMTAIIMLKGTVIIESAFPLLPITRLDLTDIVTTKKKCKIPWVGKEHAGKIFSAKFLGINRGIIKTSKKSFRNAVGLEICTTKKNIYAKLCKEKIQMCGANSEAVALETAQHIIDHLIRIQGELDYMHSLPAERDATIKWFLKECKGDLYTISEETQEIVTLEPGEHIKNDIVCDISGKPKLVFKEVPFSWEHGDTVKDKVIVDEKGHPYRRALTKKEIKDGIKEYPIIRIGDGVRLNDKKLIVDEKGILVNKIILIPLRVVDVISVKIPDYVLKSLRETGKKSFPEGVNSRIGLFYLEYIQDYAYYHVLTSFFEGISEITRVYEHRERKKGESDLSIANMDTAMVNYSLTLRMNVNRWALCSLINEEGVFHATYDNTTDHHVTITIEYIADKKESIKRKCNQISFMVYKSGIVTISGPSCALMREPYYKFMRFVQRHYDKIRLNDGKPINLKFKKSTSSSYDG